MIQIFRKARSHVYELIDKGYTADQIREELSRNPFVEGEFIIDNFLGWTGSDLENIRKGRSSQSSVNIVNILETGQLKIQEKFPKEYESERIELLKQTEKIAQRIASSRLPVTYEDLYLGTNSLSKRISWDSEKLGIYARENDLEIIYNQKTDTKFPVYLVIRGLLNSLIFSRGYLSGNSENFESIGMKIFDLKTGANRKEKTDSLDEVLDPKTTNLRLLRGPISTLKLVFRIAKDMGSSLNSQQDD